MILAKNGIIFKEYEKEIFKQCCLSGCELIKTKLETYDAELAKVRDKSKYRNKGKRKTVIKTVMGEVEYSRNVYEFYDNEGKKSFVYLLDEAIGIKGSGFMSGLMSELIAQSVCEAPYRSAAHSVSEMTGQSISHTAAWKVVQDLGEGVGKGEQLASKAAEESRGTGELLTPVLFEEQDGIWLNLQGKSRKQYGKSKEMRLAIAYDGTKKVCKDRYELTNKVACANFESGEKFQKRKEGIVARSYNVDEIEMRLLNGDGAAWIKQAMTDETVHFQLDTFHRNKAIRTYVKNPKMQKEIKKLLYDQQIDELLVYIEALSNSVEDINERDNLLTLHTYFANNKVGLVPCHKRGLNIPNPPEGKEYRHMGAMESNVFTIAGNRMKGRRACWSIEGGNNLVRLLCLKCTNKLSETLQNLTSVVLPEKYSEEISIGLSAGKVSESSGKGYAGFRKGAPAPATPNYKWLREIGSQRSLV